LVDIFESLARHQRGAARDARDSLTILREYTGQSRFGRKSGAGIYDYNARQERVDPTGSRNLFAPSVRSPAPDEIEQRLFVIQTIEALHAMREGIVDDSAMGDLASVLGWSYPASRGGVISYRDLIGQDKFKRVRIRLQGKFGDRFAMPD
jgi:3-hydroxyacyl-CoA dehydrogenase/enoyl-CoA hydratase/3-hydroxybutyryl-CoA epimerase